MFEDHQKFQELVMNIDESMTCSLSLDPCEPVFNRIVHPFKAPVNSGKAVYFRLINRNEIGDNRCFFVHGTKVCASVVDGDKVESFNLGFELTPSSNEQMHDVLRLKAMEMIATFLTKNPEIKHSCLIVDEDLSAWARHQIAKIRIDGLIIKMKRADITSCLFDKFGPSKIDTVPYLMRQLSTLGDTAFSIIKQSDRIMITENSDYCFMSNLGDRELIQNNFLTLAGDLTDFPQFDQYLLLLNKSSKKRT